MTITRALIIFTYLITLILSAVPPACLLSCASTIARLSEHPSLKDYPFICYNRITMNRCLVDTCPFGNFLSARDHFLGTCMEFIQATHDDPEFNFDMTHPICNTTESQFILLQYSQFDIVNKVNTYPKAYLKALAEDEDEDDEDDDDNDDDDEDDDDGDDDDGDDEGDDNFENDGDDDDDDQEDGEGNFNDDDASEDGDANNDYNNTPEDDGNEPEGQYPEREPEGEIEHEYDEEEALREEEEEEQGRGRQPGRENPPTELPSDEYIPPSNEELILEKCSHNLDFYFAEGLSRRNAIREYQNMVQSKRVDSTRNHSVPIEELKTTHRKLANDYYFTYFTNHSNKALQKAMRIYAKANNNTIPLPKSTMKDIENGTVSNSSLENKVESGEVPINKRPTSFQFEFATSEQILNYKGKSEGNGASNDGSKADSVNIQAKARKKTTSGKSRSRKASTSTNNRNRNRKASQRQRQIQSAKKAQAQRKANMNRQRAKEAHSTQKMSGAESPDKRKKVQFSSNLFGSKLNHRDNYPNQNH